VVDPASRVPAGEEPNPQFDPNEQLYMRVPMLDVDDVELDVVSLEDIPRLPLSVNRGSLSVPEDVIVNHPGWGIIGFPVGAIPETLAAEQGDAKYQFRLVPIVEQGNAAHADIVCFKDGRRVEKSSKIAETVKAAFRESIRSQAYWIKKPDRRPRD
jgi:hypothetical protein